MQRIAPMSKEPYPPHQRRMTRELGNHVLRATSSGDGELGKQRLPRKHGDQSLVLRAHYGKSAVVLCTCNSNTKEPELGGSLSLASDKQSKTLWSFKRS